MEMAALFQISIFQLLGYQPTATTLDKSIENNVFSVIGSFVLRYVK